MMNVLQKFFVSIFGKCIWNGYADLNNNNIIIVAISSIILCISVDNCRGLIILDRIQIIQHIRLWQQRQGHSNQSYSTCA